MPLQHAAFGEEAFYPCYGLAEATRSWRGGREVDPAHDLLWGYEPLWPRDRVTASQAEDARSLVSCGQAAADQEIWMLIPTLVSPATLNKVERNLAGCPSVAQGYWHQTETTQQTFAADLADGTRAISANEGSGLFA